MFLITGAAGFIGSVLSREIQKKFSEKIIIVDRLGSDPKWKNLRKLSNYDFIHADDFINNDDYDFLKTCRCIFHIGACSSTTEKNVDYLMENNVEYSKFMFRLATKYKIPFIYASSAATYGDGSHGYDDQSCINQYKPLNPYGFSKQLFDQWVLERKNLTAPVYGFKFFNVYGPNEYHKDNMCSMVYKAFEQIKSHGVVKLFKSHRPDYQDGEQLRDFVYVKDVVNLMIHFFENSSSIKSGLYNLGSGQARSFNDLVKQVFVSLGKKANIDYIPMPDSLIHQYQYYTCAKMDKCFNEIKNYSLFSLEDGVSDYVENYLLKEDAYY